MIITNGRTVSGKGRNRMTLQELDVFLQKKAKETLNITHTKEPDDPESCATLDSDWFIQKNEKFAFMIHPSCFNYRDGRSNWKHRHDFLEMFFVYQGSCRQVINGKTIELQEGDVCILNTNVSHTVSVANGDDILINCLFRKSYFDMTFLCQISENDLLSSFFTQAIYQTKSTNDYIVFHCHTQENIREVICRAICEYYDKKMCSDTIVNSYMLIMFSELLRAYKQEVNTSSYKTFGQINISDIVMYLNDHYSTATLKSTAQHFDFHPNYLSSIFKKLTGMRFIDFLHQKRLQEACIMLKSTDIPIDQIANSIGYFNMSFFYKLFKNKYGITPSKYRKDHRDDNS